MVYTPDHRPMICEGGGTGLGRHFRKEKVIDMQHIPAIEIQNPDNLCEWTDGMQCYVDASIRLRSAT